jgi:Tfp pilus assembly protein PilP
MKKIIILLSALLLTACSNYGYVRHEESYMTNTVSNGEAHIMFIHRTSPYPYYGQRYDHRHEHRKPNREHHNRPHDDDHKPRNEQPKIHTQYDKITNEPDRKYFIKK